MIAVLIAWSGIIMVALMAAASYFGPEILLYGALLAGYIVLFALWPLILFGITVAAIVICIGIGLFSISVHN